MKKRKLVIFGAGNLVSDVFDAGLANGLVLSKVVTHLPEATGPGNISLARRIEKLSALAPAPQVQGLSDFEPGADELYILGITTPTKQALVDEIDRRFALSFCNLVHPSASVSPLARLGEGVFVGAMSVLASGVQLGNHVVVNRGATIGHDTTIGACSRVQPGATVCGLIEIGRGVTVGAGATVIERLRLGDGVFVAAGAVVVGDVANDTLVVGVPAKPAKPTQAKAARAAP